MHSGGAQQFGQRSQPAQSVLEKCRRCTVRSPKLSFAAVGAARRGHSRGRGVRREACAHAPCGVRRVPPLRCTHGTRLPLLSKHARHTPFNCRTRTTHSRFARVCAPARVALRFDAEDTARALTARADTRVGDEWAHAAGIQADAGAAGGGRGALPLVGPAAAE